MKWSPSGSKFLYQFLTLTLWCNLPKLVDLERTFNGINLYNLWAMVLPTVHPSSGFSWSTCTVDAKIIHQSWNKILYFSWTRTVRKQIYGASWWAFMTSDYWRISLDHKLIGRMLNFSQALFDLWHSPTEQPEQNANVNKQPYYAPWILSETRQRGFVTVFEELQCPQFTTGDCVHFIWCVFIKWFQWDLCVYVKTF